MKITFIGFGAMAEAIAKGLTKQGEHELSASAPSLTEGVNPEGIQTYSNNIKAVVGAEVIILAVKPIQMAAVLKEIGQHIPAESCLISVAAGLTLSWLAKQNLSNLAIIRTMPNLPAKVGLGATPMIANDKATKLHKQWAERIFSAIGIHTWLQNEKDMDGFTALSGSGPAYVFLFMEAMMDAAIHLGLDEKVVKSFTVQTLKGALKLIEDSDLNLSQLRKLVTSKKGTTAAALDVLHDKLHPLMKQALLAAKSRSEELGQM